jgi:hypothetical protein
MPAMIGKRSITVLLPFIPPAFIRLPIWPIQLTISMLQVIFILPLVVSSTFPRENPLPVQLPFLPLTDIRPRIEPCVGPLTVEEVGLEVSLVLASVRPMKLTVTFFLTVNESPSKNLSVFPGLSS